MESSQVEKCPICGKKVTPLADLTEHVEECLLLSAKIPTKATNSVPKNENKSPKTFFSPLSSKQSSKNVQKSSPKNDPKRPHFLAGKSDVSPPGKKAKLNHPKQIASAFFQPMIDKVKQADKEKFISDTKKDSQPFEKSSSDPVKQVSMFDKPVSLGGVSQKGSSQRPDDSVLGKNQAKTAKKSQFTPLAEQMRPSGLDEYLGQSKVVGENCLLRSLLQANEVPSMILWGPPGCGKTSLAHIIASGTKKTNKTRFVTLSATTSGINDVKEVIKVAKNEQQMFKRKTILFMDEIHRFNKSQQDTFLPHVENGTITLIGATTENPSFHLNNALLSRCRVFVLDKLSSEALQGILLRASKTLGLEVVESEEDCNSNCSEIVIEKDALITLSNLCDGDARVALNGLQLAVQSRKAASKLQQNKNQLENIGQLTNGISSRQKPVVVSVRHVKEGLQRTHLLYDKKGDEHFNIISALHKSMRGSDENASLYWLARMLTGGEDPLYVARRLVRFASEDVGLADPLALNQAVAAYQACHFIGMPECDTILAQATVYLARAPKSIEVYSAYNKAKQCIKEWEGPQPSVPLHIRNAPTKLMKNLGYSAGYKYNPAFDGPVDQTYLPPELDDVNFFDNKKK